MASLTDAEEALRSTNTKANFQRLTRLLMRGGLMLLREKFDSIHSPADLPLKLGDPAIQAQLKGARLTQPERACLFPSPGVYGKSTDCDITLIFRLFRTICSLTPPPGPRGWDDLPNSTDHSLEADLVRIKYYRNDVYGHKKTMELSDVEFVGLWKEISEVLLRIAATISHAKRDEWKKAIDNFLHDPLTPEEETYMEELNTWYKQDLDVKIEVEKLNKEMKTSMADMKGVIQEEVRSLREEVKKSQGPVVCSSQVPDKKQTSKRQGPNLEQSLLPAKVPRTGTVMKEGTPSNYDLEKLSKSIGMPWTDLGRRLNISEPKLEEIEMDARRPGLAAKAYQMLLCWKKENGSNATYWDLSEALLHEFVNRRDLAENICLLDK